MKRDWDVIRQVLLEVEGLNEEERVEFSYGLDEALSAEERTKGGHALLLWKAGFISALDSSNFTTQSILSPDLTWQGHELLDTLRSEPVWNRIKATAKEKGIELSFDAVKAIGKLALDWVLSQGG